MVRYALLFFALIPLSANAVLLTGKNINPTGVDYTYFSIDIADTVHLETLNGQFDPYMYLFHDDGSLDASDYIAHDDDSGSPALAWYNSLIDVALSAGNYIVAVGDFYLDISEAISGFADNDYPNNPTYDLLITAPEASIRVRDQMPVPEPEVLILLGLGLVGMGTLRKRAHIT